MARTRSIVAPLVGVAALSIALTAAIAGNITPPAGPVLPTMKDLDTVEPRVPLTQATTPGDATSTFLIKQPGSYYLVGDLSGAVGKHGVKIDSDNVTLDLRGFSLLGSPGSLSGVYIETGGLLARTGVVLHGNGRIALWGEHGVSAQQTIRMKVADLTVNNNGGFGLWMGTDGSVRNVTSNTNGADNINTGENSLVEDCVAGFSVDGFGVTVGQHSVIRNCASSHNVLSGFRTQDNCAVEGCTAGENLGSGFDLGVGALVSNSTAGGNGGVGMLVGDNGAITNCLASANAGNGFEVGAGSTVRGATAKGNLNNFVATGERSAFHDCSSIEAVTDGYNVLRNAVFRNCRATESGAHGFNVDSFVNIIGCDSRHNGGDGYRSGGNAFIEDCMAFANGSNGYQLYGNSTIRHSASSVSESSGIFVDNDSVVIDNVVDRVFGAGQAAIYVTGDRNKIDGNQLSEAPVGVDLAGTSNNNLIVRNTVVNTPVPFNIPVGNSAGAIVIGTPSTAGAWDNVVH